MSVTDNAIGIRLLDKVVEHTSTVTRAWVEAGFKRELAIHGAVLGIDIEVVNAARSSPEGHRGVCWLPEPSQLRGGSPQTVEAAILLPRTNGGAGAAWPCVGPAVAGL